MSIFSEESNSFYMKAVLNAIKDSGKDVSEIENFSEKIAEIVKDASFGFADVLIDEYKKDCPKMLEEWREEGEGFEDRLYKLWKKPLDLLEMFIILSIDAGSSFNHEFRPEAAKRNDIIFEVLTRLHSRACLTSREVFYLLKGGYASAAHARWRTLHEISVIAFFLSSNGKKTAERYINHEVIQSSKAMNQYKEHYKKLGYKPIDEEEINVINKMKKELCDKYGKCYKNTYGWASEELGKCNPNFYDIEKSVGLNHLRPIYKMSSHAIHANPKGVYFNLGISEKSENKILIAGPSDYGLTDPGHSTAISLFQVNTVLLSYKTSFNSVAILKVFQKLEKEIGEEFIKIHKTFEEV